MDTVYYHLNVRRTKVSGGADLVSFVPVSSPVPSGKKAQVLDFDRCRRRLETQAAWRELAQAAEDDSDPTPLEPQAPLPSPSQQERRLVWLDVCASVAVIAVSLAAVVSFLRLI